MTGEVLVWVGDHEASIRGWLMTVFTPVLAYFAFKAFRRGQQNDEDRDAERRREQAREVSAWVIERFEEGDLPPFLQKLSMGQTKYRDWYWSLVIGNQSGTPVYDLCARVFHVDDTETPVDVLQLVQALPRRETVVDIDRDGDSELSKIVHRQLNGDDEDDQSRSPSGVKPSDFLVELTFRDANNVRWRRSAHGLLQEYP